jgi:hypothetical protein
MSEHSNSRAILLTTGESVTVWEDDGHLFLAVDLGDGREGVFVELPPAAAAYVAGRLSGLAGVRFG